MQRVFVVDANKTPLMPCHPARARELLRTGKAAVFRRYPFTIILKERVGGEVQPVQVKVDPGSKVSGLALVADFKRGYVLLWAGELEHRGDEVKQNLAQRRAMRRNRRTRKTSYRPARFDNRRRGEGRLPPSLNSRVQNILTWVERLRRYAPLSNITLEVVKFDTQLLEQPNISGVEYQQATVAAYEVREYLLEKCQRRCAYCGKSGVPLEIEHLIPKSRGGSDRVSNLALACHACNQNKGNQTAVEYGYPHLMAQAKQPLKDAAAVNAIRWRLYNRLAQISLPIECSTGGRTKFNRTQQGYSKAHWIDAACAGTSGEAVVICPATHQPLRIMAVGRQRRQMCLMNKYGFPRTAAKESSEIHGFRTGDVVQAFNSGGKYPGWHMGRIAVRSSGSFAIDDGATVSWRNCKKLHSSDGYQYQKGELALSSPT